MTTKELIRRLEELDPEGTLEVAIGGCEPIYVVERLPAYYDGSLQVLIQDRALDPYFNVVGGKIVRSGEKIRLSAYTIEDLLGDDPDAPVDLSEARESDRLLVEQWREQGRQILREIESDTKGGG